MEYINWNMTASIATSKYDFCQIIVDIHKSQLQNWIIRRKTDLNIEIAFHV